MNCFVTTKRIERIPKRVSKSLGNAGSRGSLIGSHRENLRLAETSSKQTLTNLTLPELSGATDDISFGIRGAAKDVVLEHANKSCDSAPPARRRNNPCPRMPKKKRFRPAARENEGKRRKSAGEATVQTAVQTTERPAEPSAIQPCDSCSNRHRQRWLPLQPRVRTTVHPVVRIEYP